MISLNRLSIIYLKNASIISIFIKKLAQNIDYLYNEGVNSKKGARINEKIDVYFIRCINFSLVSCVNDNGNASIDSKVNQGEESMKQSDEYQHIYVDSFTVITSYNQLVDLNKDGWEISGYDENYFTENNLVVFHFTKIVKKSSRYSKFKL